MRFLVLEEVDSTNSYVSRHASELEDMTMVIADRQTAGRGQRGNTWESAPGENLTFTMLHRNPPVSAREQFSLSEAVALAVRDYLLETGIKAQVKWPNDIYVGDGKIAGILIEHALMGPRIEHTRIGVGLNVNQEKFVSDAPNPVSMVGFLGERLDISRVAASVGLHIERRLRQASSSKGREKLHDEFRCSLWRGEGCHPFRRRDNGETFTGSIVDVSTEGPIHIRDASSGKTEQFWFKEVEFLLTKN